VLPTTGAFSVVCELQLNVRPGMYILESFVWNNIAGRELGTGLTAYMRVTGSDQFSGPVNMLPRVRVVSAVPS
jgi:hypothetical protein